MNEQDKKAPSVAKLNYDERELSYVTTEQKPEKNLIFDGSNLLWVAIGLLLVVFGFVLMSGGQMPDADTFDKNIIYSTRRITIAPIVVISGLMVIVYAIFKKSKS